MDGFVFFSFPVV